MAPLARSTTSKTTTSIVSRLAAAEISAAPDTVESGRGAAPGGDALDGEKHEADAKPDIEHVFVKDDPRAWSRARKVRCSYFMHYSCFTEFMSRCRTLPWF